MVGWGWREGGVNDNSYSFSNFSLISLSLCTITICQLPGRVPVFKIVLQVCHVPMFKLFRHMNGGHYEHHAVLTGK